MSLTTLSRHRSGHSASALLALVTAISLLGCRPTPDPSAEARKQARNAEILRSLPYANWVPVAEGSEPVRKGVTLHDPDRAFPGLNLLTPRNQPRAYLVNMDGKLVHEWWNTERGGGAWQHVELTANGDLLALVKDRRLLRIDPSSKLRWSSELRFHHEAFEGPDGLIYGASRSEQLATLHGIEVPILIDFVTILSPDGEVQRKLSLLDPFRDQIPRRRVEALRDWAVSNGVYEALAEPSSARRIVIESDTPADLFHLNSIEVIQRDIPGVCHQGDLLISPRQLDLIAVLDPLAERIVWSWGPGELERQHHPTLLESGNILVFDNGPARGYSRVLEIDPVRREIVWEYRGTDESPFFSVSRGSNQRLPNGNTLITETDNGRAFEVTQSGDMVWEFFCPVLQKVEGRTCRAAIYRVERIIDLEALLPLFQPEG